jgi:hypothetical protein
MLKGGFLTGYSQGGSYAWRKCEACGGNLPLQQGANFCEACGELVAVRYGLKRLAEVSYVDSPAIGEGFEHVKAGGSLEIIKFQKRKEAPVAKEKKTKRVAGEDLTADCFAYVGDPEKTETWKLPIKFSTEAKTKRHIQNALARFGQTKGIPADEKEKVKATIIAAAKDHGIDVEAESGKAVAVRDMIKARIDTAAIAKGLEKGLYAVSRYAELLEMLSCLYEQSVWERDIEGDDSDVPDELLDQLNQMIETFIAMAEEEARELAANKNDTPPGANAMTQEELDTLQKAAKKSLASHFAKAASHHEKMADKHEAIADEHETAAAAHAEMADKSECKCGKADVSETPEHDAIHEVLAAQEDFHKSMQKCEMAKAKQHDGMAALHDKMAEHLTKMAEANDDSQDKADTAAILKAERETTDPAPAVKVAPAAPTMEADVAKAAQLQRETPEYKQAIADIAKAAVDAEVAALRDKTLAPIGVVVDPKAVVKGAVAAVRRGAEAADEVELVSSSASSNAGGL